MELKLGPLMSGRCSSGAGVTEGSRMELVLQVLEKLQQLLSQDKIVTTGVASQNQSGQESHRKPTEKSGFLLFFPALQLSSSSLHWHTLSQMSWQH